MEDVRSNKVSKPHKRLPLRCLNHISRVVKDVEKSAAFYCMLGFVRIKRPELPCQGAWLWSDAYAIGVHLLKGTPPARSSNINPQNDHMSFEAESTDEVEACLKQLGIEYVTALVEEDGMQVTQLFFHDPDNNMIEVCNCDVLPIVPLPTGGSCSTCFASAAQQQLSLLSQLSQLQQEQEELEEQQQECGSQCSDQTDEERAGSFCSGPSSSDDSMGIAPALPAPTRNVCVSGGNVHTENCNGEDAGRMPLSMQQKQRQASVGRSDSCGDNMGHAAAAALVASSHGVSLALSSAIYSASGTVGGGSLTVAAPVGTGGNSSILSMPDSCPANMTRLSSPFQNKGSCEVPYGINSFAPISAQRRKTAHPPYSSSAYASSKHAPFPPSVLSHRQHAPASAFATASKHLRFAVDPSDSGSDASESGEYPHAMDVDAQGVLQAQGGPARQRPCRSLQQEEITHFMLSSMGPSRSAPVWV